MRKHSGWIAVLAAFVVCGSAAAIAGADNGRFGNDTPGSQSTPAPAGFKFGSIYSLSEDANGPLTFNFFASGGTGAQSFVPAVYAVDGAGNPTALKATGDAVVVGAGADGAWYQSTLSGASTLPNGRYVLALVSGVVSGEGGGPASVYLEPNPGGFFNENAGSAPSDPFDASGVVGQEAHFYSFYVSYTTSGPSGATSTYRAEPARGAYCAVAGNSNPFTGAPIPTGSFLNLGLGQPAYDGHYKGAVPAFYVEGEGLTCDPPPALLAAAGDLVDQVGKIIPPSAHDPGAIYPYFRKP